MTNTVTLPQSIFKRLEKISASSKRTPEAIVKQAVKNQLEYEEWFNKQVEAGLADVKAGRVFTHEEALQKLEQARNVRKKAA